MNPLLIGNQTISPSDSNSCLICNLGIPKNETTETSAGEEETKILSVNEMATTEKYISNLADLLELPSSVRSKIISKVSDYQRRRIKFCNSCVMILNDSVQVLNQLKSLQAKVKQMKDHIKSLLNISSSYHKQRHSKSIPVDVDDEVIDIDGFRRLIITACNSTDHSNNPAVRRGQKKKYPSQQVKADLKQFEMKQLSVNLVRLTENEIDMKLRGSTVTGRSRKQNVFDDVDDDSKFYDSLEMVIKDEPDFEEANVENDWLDLQMGTEEILENNLEHDVLDMGTDFYPDDISPRSLKSNTELTELGRSAAFEHKRSNSKNKSNQTTKTKGRVKKKGHIKCTECNALFYSKIQQKRHIRAKHKVDIELVLPFICSTCNSRFYLESQLKTHLKEQNDQCKIEPIPEYCSYITGQGGGKKFQCNICNIGFLTVSCVKKHYTIVHCCNGKRFTCDICGIGLKSKYGLTNHKLRLHYNGTIENHPYKCVHEGCNNKIFTNSNLLKIHLKRHRKEYEFLCTKCNFKSVTIGFLNSHYKQKHSVEAEDGFKCKECAKCFSSTQRLKTHILQIHTNPKDRPFPCNYCERSFSGKFELRQHELCSHNHNNSNNGGIKPIECKICKARFAVKIYLLKHMKKYHKEELEKNLATKRRNLGKCAGIY